LAVPLKATVADGLRWKSGSRRCKAIGTKWSRRKRLVGKAERPGERSSKPKPQKVAHRRVNPAASPIKPTKYHPHSRVVRTWCRTANEMSNTASLSGRLYRMAISSTFLAILCHSIACIAQIINQLVHLSPRRLPLAESATATNCDGAERRRQEMAAGRQAGSMQHEQAC